MGKEIKYFYEFGPFRIDTVNRRLLREGETVPLKAKAVETLLLLVQHNGEVVEKDDLMKWLWPDSFVEEANLTQNIYMLRKALGTAGYIETVPRRGYRFAAAVREWEETPSDLIVIKEKTSVSYEEEIDDTFEQESLEASDEAEEEPQSIDAAGRHALVQSTKTERAGGALSRYRIWIVGALSSAAIVLAIIFWPRASRLPFENARLTRFTTEGNAVRAAISPDGKYLAHVSSEGGQQSLWLRQVATGKDLQVIAPARTEFYGLTFSHDGSYIYYVSQEMNHLGMLFQVPSLGGAPTRLLEDVDSPVTLSPDDKRLAFIRYSPADRSLVIANVDGSGERKLASTPQTASVRIGVTGLLPLAWIPPAWSPDGKTIACPVTITTPEGQAHTVWAFQAEDGQGHSFTPARWQTVGRMEWLADGSGLLISAADQEANPAQQIWHLSYPGGEARKVTNDLNDYHDLSVTRDGRTLIAVQSERKANIYIASSADLKERSQLTDTNYDGLGGLAWTPDGRLVYTLQANGEQNLWVNDFKGNTKQLTSHAGLNQQPVVSPDGRYIVFVSNRTGLYHLWRMEVDGTRPQELTHGAADSEPDISADGQWVVYRSIVAGRGNIFRVSINGGEPVLVTNGISALPVVSPDGQQIALIYRPTSAGVNQFAVMPWAGGEPRLIRDLPAHYGGFHWMPDGAGLAYSDKQSAARNIWVQPVDGRPPLQLTDFGTNPIFSFAWSRDGSRLAFAGGTQTSDVLLITDVRQ